MSSDNAKDIATIGLVAVAVGVIGFGAWFYQQRQAEPDYVSDMRTRAEVQYEIERTLAIIRMANEDIADPWHITETTSLKDDSEIVMLHSRAMAPISIRGRNYETPGLRIRCVENTTSVLLMFDSFIGSRDRRVEYRVDDDPLKGGTWGASTDNKIVGLWSGAQAIPFAKSLLDGEELTVWITPHNSSGILVRFNIKSLREHIHKVADACNWSHRL